MEWLTPAAVPSPSPAGPSGAAAAQLNFYAVTDADTLQRLQALLSVPAGVRLGVGRDYDRSGSANDDYDYLEVAHAWRVVNREKQARFAAFREGLSAHTPCALRPAHALPKRRHSWRACGTAPSH